MAQENVKLFLEALAKDKNLKDKVLEMSKKYEGKTLDEEKLNSIYQNELMPFAKECGFEFTLSEYKSYGLQAKKVETGKLDDDELKAVSGGVPTGLIMGFWMCPNCNVLQQYQDYFNNKGCINCGFYG